MDDFSSERAVGVLRKVFGLGAGATVKFCPTPRGIVARFNGRRVSVWFLGGSEFSIKEEGRAPFVVSVDRGSE